MMMTSRLCSVQVVCVCLLVCAMFLCASSQDAASNIKATQFIDGGIVDPVDNVFDTFYPLPGGSEWVVEDEGQEEAYLYTTGSARLVTNPLRSDTSAVCVHFRYIIPRDAVRPSTLIVYHQSYPELAGLLDTAGQPTGGGQQWTRYRRTVMIADADRLIFMVISESGTSRLLLDDLLILPGSCDGAAFPTTVTSSPTTHQSTRLPTTAEEQTASRATTGTSRVTGTTGARTTQTDATTTTTVATTAVPRTTARTTRVENTSTGTTPTGTTAADTSSASTTSAGTTPGMTTITLTTSSEATPATSPPQTTTARTTTVTTTEPRSTTTTHRTTLQDTSSVATTMSNTITNTQTSPTTSIGTSTSASTSTSTSSSTSTSTSTVSTSTTTVSSTTPTPTVRPGNTTTSSTTGSPSVFNTISSSYLSSIDYTTISSSTTDSTMSRSSSILTTDVQQGRTTPGTTTSSTTVSPTTPSTITTTIITSVPTPTTPTSTSTTPTTPTTTPTTTPITPSIAPTTSTTNPITPTSTPTSPTTTPTTSTTPTSAPSSPSSTPASPTITSTTSTSTSTISTPTPTNLTPSRSTTTDSFTIPPMLPVYCTCDAEVCSEDEEELDTGAPCTMDLRGGVLYFEQWNGTTRSGTNYGKDFDVPPGGDNPATGPTGAYQGTNYIYVDASYTGAIQEERRVASLLLTTTNDEESCLRFAYCMNGYNMGKLQINDLSDDGSRVLWELSGDQGIPWHLAAIDIQAATNNRHTIEVQAQVGGAYNSDIALDDIAFTTGPCQPTVTGILWYCDFELDVDTATMCQMVQDESNDSFDWSITRGPTPSEDTGPDQAHSLQYYAYIEATNKTVDDAATLCFAASTRSRRDVCVEFAYNMYGYHVQTLQLLKRDVTSQRSQVMYGRQGNLQTTRWQVASVDVELQRGEQICFRGSVNGKFSGDIAIDTIKVHDRPC